MGDGIAFEKWSLKNHNDRRTVPDHLRAPGVPICLHHRAGRIRHPQCQGQSHGRYRNTAHARSCCALHGYRGSIQAQTAPRSISPPDGKWIAQDFIGSRTSSLDDCCSDKFESRCCWRCIRRRDWASGRWACRRCGRRRCRRSLGKTVLGTAE
jgi:hypothetical protein